MTWEPEIREIERRKRLASPFRTAESYNIEEIVDSRETRPLLCEWVGLAYESSPRPLGRRMRSMCP